MNGLPIMAYASWLPIAPDPKSEERKRKDAVALLVLRVDIEPQLAAEPSAAVLRA
jgi:hypothetical protein